MKNIAIVLGSFHKAYMTQMLDAARATAKQEGVNILEEVWVPGSMEKPLMIKTLLQRPDIDGIAVLGIIEKGETKHGFIMADVVINAIIGFTAGIYETDGRRHYWSRSNAQPDSGPCRTLWQKSR